MFFGKTIVEIAVDCAACTFNKGFQPLLKIMETMGVSVGEEVANLARRQNENRIFKSKRCSSECSKEQRMALEIAKMEKNQSYEKAEELIYGAGIAD